MPAFFFHLKIDLLLKEPSNVPVDLIDHLKSEASAKDTSHPSALLLGSTTSHDIKPSLDYRLRKITQRTISMPPLSPSTNATTPKQQLSTPQLRHGLAAQLPSGLATRASFEPLNSGNAAALDTEEDLGWGIVRLYRDQEETPGLYDEVERRGSRHGSFKYASGEPSTELDAAALHASPSMPASVRSPTAVSASRSAAAGPDQSSPSHITDESCTTLCILAVPAYLTPSDFLGFVGDETRAAVQHFRMIRTDRYRYMVLMKFRNGRTARHWRRAWNGRPFDQIEPEYCHVVFVKSVEYRGWQSQSFSDQSNGPEEVQTFPDIRHDPFVPRVPRQLVADAKGVSTLSTKPQAPPTPNLVELPTCPVCLERMDESTGLLTILCQHVFHCTCLQKWRGNGCPVCRYSQQTAPIRAFDALLPSLKKDGDDPGEPPSCGTCHADSNLWICLICGSVGCGRYDNAHAFAHHADTGHCFAMDLTTQRVWDYGSDGYVHRLLANNVLDDASDGSGHDDTKKPLPEMPAARDSRSAGSDGSIDVVPREKLDAITQEYTSLLTSQLDSQRLYFAEALSRAADKAALAAGRATESEASAELLRAELESLHLAHDNMTSSTVPSLEKDRSRHLQRATRFEAAARELELKWKSEQAVSSGLLERIAFLESSLAKATASNEELREEVRDLGMFISGAAQLQQSGVDASELAEGSVSVADPSSVGAGHPSQDHKKRRKKKKPALPPGARSDGDAATEVATSEQSADNASVGTSSTVPQAPTEHQAPDDKES